MTNNRIVAIKRMLLFSTITLFSISAFLGIVFVLVSADSTAWKISGTVFVFALLSLFSMNNVFRLESERKSVKYLSVVVLISNIFWSLPWILIIWNVFGLAMCTETVIRYTYSYSQCPESYYDVMRFIYQLAGTAGIISLTVTVVANLLHIKDYSMAIKYLRISGISSAIFLGVYFLPSIWFSEANYISDTWRLIAVVAIIFAFSTIVTPILVKITRNKLERATPAPQMDEARLRQEIEAEVRAKIAQEIASSATTTDETNK